jgi:hypothetical protein
MAEWVRPVNSGKKVMNVITQGEAIKQVRELQDKELDSVCGGWLTQWIHMDYHNMNNFNDPTAVRYA